MPLLKSLFCLQGLDNRIRFSIINFTVYTLFLITNVFFISSLTAQLILLLCFTILSAFTTLRRVHDARINQKWAISIPLIFLLCGLIITLVESPIANWLVMIPVCLTLVVITYPSQAKNNYILGYFGPVDLNSYDQPTRAIHKQRIEPSLAGTTINESEINANLSSTTSTNEYSTKVIKPTAYEQSSAAKADNMTSDIGERIRASVLRHKKSTLIMMLIVISILSLTIIYNMLSLTESLVPERQMPETKIPDNVRTSKISFPDNFSLLLSQHKGLVVNWQVEFSEQGNIWDIHTAKGDNTCQEIVFNNGKKFRTLKVTAENSADYFATFSPLDTKSLLKEIAFRGKFSLCGYPFSLKGSQAILGKNPDYANMIEY